MHQLLTVLGILRKDFEGVSCVSKQILIKSTEANRYCHLEVWMGVHLSGSVGGTLDS